MKSKSPEEYEANRQRFLNLLGQHRMIWQKTSDECDMNVEISRIYRENQSEYVAFMRIRPKGFRGERVTTANMEIIFHLLFGRVVFNYKRKPRQLTRGSSITVGPRSTYSIRCLGDDQPAYFVFQIKQHKQKTSNKQKLLAIEAAPIN